MFLLYEMNYAMRFVKLLEELHMRVYYKLVLVHLFN